MALSKTPVAFIDIRFSAHATEDPEKVQRATHNLFPENFAEEIMFNRDIVRGYHGNPIILFRVRLKDKSLIKAFVDRLSRGLSDLDKNTLSRESGLVLEKNSLFLRLDKQAAFQGDFRFQRADPIHIRIHFKSRGEKSVFETCRELGLMI